MCGGFGLDDRDKWIAIATKQKNTRKEFFGNFLSLGTKQNFVNSENKIKTVPVLVCSYFQRKYFFKGGGGGVKNRQKMRYVICERPLIYS